MAQVCSHLPALRAAGARLAFVGSGTPSMARAFREEASLPSEVALLVDPDLAVYRALKLKRGVFSALSARSVAGAAKAWRAGHRQGAVAGKYSDLQTAAGAEQLDQQTHELSLLR